MDRRFSRRIILILACLGLLLIGPPLVAGSQAWSVSWLSSDDDWPIVVPNEMNDSERISGYYYSYETGSHALVWKSPTSAPKELDPLSGDENSWAADINASGTICGVSGAFWAAQRAVTWDQNGNVTDRHPGGDWNRSDMWSINDAGHGVGELWEGEVSEWISWAGYWPNKGDVVVLDKGVADYHATWALSINKNGLIAGAAQTQDWAWRACYWDGYKGDLVDIQDAIEDAAGEALKESYAYEATDSDEVVGYCVTLSGTWMAFLYTEGGGVIFLDDGDGGTGNAFAWQSQGKYVLGAVNGGLYSGDEVPAIWERGTSKGNTTWTLHTLPVPSGYVSASTYGASQAGSLVGVATDADGNVRAWYAKRSGKK